MQQMPNNTLENKIKLKPYYLAYIDILGIKDAINSDKSEDVLIKIKGLFDRVRQATKTFDEGLPELKIETRIFSDNIVIAIDKNYCFHTSIDEWKQMILIDVVSYFQILGYQYSFLTRGCVTEGDLYIDKNFIYGKALTKAYLTESKNATYPRIIINYANVNDFVQNNSIRKYLIKDFDGTCYVDSFQRYFDRVKENKSEEISYIRDVLLDKMNEPIKENNMDRVNPKRYWVLNKFNEFCRNNNFEQYVIDIGKFPYDPNYIRTIITGSARELENVK